MIKILDKIILLLLIFFTSLASATDAQELIQLLNSIHSLQASFEQFLVNSQGKVIGEKSIGTMLLERPGRFRWEIKSPTKQLVIINHNHSLFYDAELNQVINRKVEYQYPSNPALLLSGSPAALARSFKITKLKADGGRQLFQLTPIASKVKADQTSEYRWIRVGFLGSQLNSMVVASNLGGLIKIMFKKIKLNPKISASQFQFKPPADVELFNTE